VITVDLTPGAQEQENLLAFFAAQVMDDIKVARKSSDRRILRSIVDLAFTLGFNAASRSDVGTGTGRVQAMALRQRLADSVR